MNLPCEIKWKINLAEGIFQGHINILVCLMFVKYFKHSTSSISCQREVVKWLKSSWIMFFEVTIQGFQINLTLYYMTIMRGLLLSFTTFNFKRVRFLSFYHLKPSYLSFSFQWSYCIALKWLCFTYRHSCNSKVAVAKTIYTCLGIYFMGLFVNGFFLLNQIFCNWEWMN